MDFLGFLYFFLVGVLFGWVLGLEIRIRRIYRILSSPLHRNFRPLRRPPNAHSTPNH